MIETITEFLLPTTEWILFASLKSLIVIPLVLLIRRLSARWLTQQGRYGLWFAVIACLSIPFGAQVRIDGESPGATPAPSRAVSQATLTQHEQPTISIVDAPAAATSNLSMASKAILAWLVGVAGLAIVVLHNTSRYRRMKSRASYVDTSTEELFGSCKQMLKIRQHVRLLETSQVESPIAVGFWRPTLLLPRNLSTRISGEQLRLVLLHELAHIRRHDILANWLITLVQIAHWFNPLAWYALRIMRNDMELACDTSVLHHLSTSEQIEYGDTLIRLSGFASQRTLLAQNASVVDNRSQIKARINMIAQFRSRGAANSVLGAVLIALISAIAVTQAANAPQPTPASQAAPERAAPQQSTPEADTGKAVESSAPAATRSEGIAPVLEPALFQIRYAIAKDVASLIRSVPDFGLLSDNGSVVVDANANTLLVSDTASNVSAIRQLVAKLDVPLEQIPVEALVAVVDSDLLQELMAIAEPSNSWPKATIFRPDQAVMRLLEAGRQVNRADILSAQRITVANHAQSSFQQGAEVLTQQDTAPGTAEKSQLLRLALRPTVIPDRRMTLDIDFSVRAMNPNPLSTPGNAHPPYIDTWQLKTQLVLDSGATVLLDATGGSGSARRLVAFLTPNLMPDPTANPR